MTFHISALGSKEFPIAHTCHPFVGVKAVVQIQHTWRNMASDSSSWICPEEQASLLPQEQNFRLRPNTVTFSRF
jgi:hypothetical protein